MQQQVELLDSLCVQCYKNQVMGGVHFYDTADWPTSFNMIKVQAIIQTTAKAITKVTPQEPSIIYVAGLLMEFCRTAKLHQWMAQFA